MKVFFLFPEILDQQEADRRNVPRRDADSVSLVQPLGVGAVLVFHVRVAADARRRHPR